MSTACEPPPTASSSFWNFRGLQLLQDFQQQEQQQQAQYWNTSQHHIPIWNQQQQQQVVTQQQWKPQQQELSKPQLQQQWDQQQQLWTEQRSYEHQQYPGQQQWTQQNQEQKAQQQRQDQQLHPWFSHNPQSLFHYPPPSYHTNITCVQYPDTTSNTITTTTKLPYYNVHSSLPSPYPSYQSYHQNAGPVLQENDNNNRQNDCLPNQNQQGFPGTLKNFDQTCFSENNLTDGSFTTHQLGNVDCGQRELGGSNTKSQQAPLLSLSVPSAGHTWNLHEAQPLYSSSSSNSSDYYSNGVRIINNNNNIIICGGNNHTINNCKNNFVQPYETSVSGSEGLKNVSDKNSETVKGTDVRDKEVSKKTSVNNSKVSKVSCEKNSESVRTLFTVINPLSDDEVVVESVANNSETLKKLSIENNELLKTVPCSTDRITETPRNVNSNFHQSTNKITNVTDDHNNCSIVAKNLGKSSETANGLVRSNKISVIKELHKYESDVLSGVGQSSSETLKYSVAVSICRDVPNESGNEINKAFDDSAKSSDSVSDFVDSGKLVNDTEQTDTNSCIKSFTENISKLSHESWRSLQELNVQKSDLSKNSSESISDTTEISSVLKNGVIKDFTEIDAKIPNVKQSRSKTLKTSVDDKHNTIKDSSLHHTALLNKTQVNATDGALTGSLNSDLTYSVQNNFGELRVPVKKRKLPFQLNESGEESSGVTVKTNSWKKRYSTVTDNKNLSSQEIIDNKTSGNLKSNREIKNNLISTESKKPSVLPTANNEAGHRISAEQAKAKNEISTKLSERDDNQGPGDLKSKNETPNGQSKLSQTSPETNGIVDSESPSAPEDTECERKIEHPKDKEDMMKTVCSPPKYPLARFPKTITCHVCHDTVKEYRVSAHLYFGSLRCSDCNLKISTCENFEEVKKEMSSSSRDPRQSCLHKFLKWSHDPAFFLRRRIRKALKRKLDIDNPLEADVLRKVSVYLENLRFLAYRSPWKSAIKEIKRNLAADILEEELKKEALDSAKICNKDRVERHSHKERRHSRKKHNYHSSSKDREKNHHHHRHGESSGDKSSKKYKSHSHRKHSSDKSHSSSGNASFGCLDKATEKEGITKAEENQEEIYVSPGKQTVTSKKDKERAVISHKSAESNVLNSQSEECENKLDTLKENDERPRSGLKDEFISQVFKNKVQRRKIINDCKDNTQVVGKSSVIPQTVEEEAIIPQTEWEVCVISSEGSVAEQFDDSSISIHVNDDEDDLPMQIVGEINIRNGKSVFTSVEVTTSEGRDKKYEVKSKVPLTGKEKEPDVVSEETTEVCIGSPREKENNQTEKGKTAIDTKKSEEVSYTSEEIKDEPVKGFDNINARDQEVDDSTTEETELFPKELDELQTATDADDDSKVEHEVFKMSKEQDCQMFGFDRNKMKASELVEEIRKKLVHIKKDATNRMQEDYATIEKLWSEKKYNLRSQQRRRKSSRYLFKLLHQKEKKGVFKLLLPAFKAFHEHSSRNEGNEPLLSPEEMSDDLMMDIILSKNYRLEDLDEVFEYFAHEGDDRLDDIMSQVRDIIDSSSYLSNNCVSPSRSIRRSSTRLLHQCNGTLQNPKQSERLQVKTIEEDGVKIKKEMCSSKPHLDPMIFGRDITAETQDPRIHFVNPPPDGRYYVVKYPNKPCPEECPLCYCRIFPCMFSLNLVTNLATGQCFGCDLIIYIIQEPVDTSLPKIVFRNTNKGGHLSFGSSDDKVYKPKPARYKKPMRYPKKKKVID